MKRFVLLVVAAAALGCVRVPVAVPKLGPPTPVALNKDANPDVLWVVREVQAPERMGQQRTFWALFACYRQPAEKAGAPQCYIAEHIAKPEEISWPGALQLGLDGVLRVRTIPEPRTRR